MQLLLFFAIWLAAIPRYAAVAQPVPEYGFAKYALLGQPASSLGTNVVNHIRYSESARRLWLAGRNGLVYTDDGGATFHTITAIQRFNENGIQA